MNARISIITFLELFEEISSVDLQVKLWLNIENNTGLMSSYTELMNNFDTGEFSYVVENVIQETEFKKELKQLIEMINTYKEPKQYMEFKNDVYIVADGNWKKIRDFAKDIGEKHFGCMQELRDLL